MQPTLLRVAALAVVALISSSALTPVASGSSQLNVRSVGEIFVDASGRASGQNLAAGIAEAQGLISGFVSHSLGTEIFSKVSIEGFAQAEKIQGVGSSSLLLRGSNAVVAIHDNINTVVKVQTSQATTVRYDFAPGVRAEADGRGILNLYQGETYLGSLVFVGGAAPDAVGAAFSFAKGRAEAHTKAGSTVVFLAKPVYLETPEFHRAVVHAAAQGSLASSYVTEFQGSAIAASQVDYSSLVLSATSSRAWGVESTVRSRAEPGAVLAYDVAYEMLPARSAEEVSVFVNGQLAARANSPEEVRHQAAEGKASYYAVAHNGRSQILASTPDFRSAAEHRVSIAANAGASTEAQASAEDRAQQSNRVYGDFEYHTNGKLTGDFLTGIFGEQKLQLYSFTSLASRTEVFKLISIDGGEQANFRASGHHFQAVSPRADLTLVDDAHATMLVDAKARAEATFDLAHNVKAHQEAPNLVLLEAPNGYAAAMIVTGKAAHASTAAPSLVVEGEGRVRAQLEPGQRLVYRGEQYQAQPHEDAIVRAIAEGKIGAQILTGVKGSGIASTRTAYVPGVVADVRGQARGSLDIDYKSMVPDAKSFVIDTRGASIAAKSTSDVRVLVDGRPALPSPSPEAALAAGAYPRYYAESSLDGGLRMIVNTAAAQGALARVTVESQLDSAARASVNKDAFGTFKMFYDGTAVGSFVTLKSDKRAGVVSDFTMISTGTEVFSSIVAGASPFASAGADGTSVLVLENRESRLEFTDTTNAYMRVVPKVPTETAFRLAEGVRAEARAATVVELSTSAGDHVGSMIITGVEGNKVVLSRFVTGSDGHVRAQLEQGAQVIYRSHVGIESELSSAQRTMINQAIAGAHVAGHVVIQTQSSLSDNAKAAAAQQRSLEATAHATSQAQVDGVAIGATEAYGQVTSAVTTSWFNDVQMVTAATQKRVDVTISSTTDVGKTIIISLDPQTVAGMARGDAVILFDGKVASQASSYADILNPNDDGGVAEYFVLAGEAGTQVLVSIPSFSVHTVTLQERETGSAPIFMFATVFLGLLVAVQTAILVRRRNA